jgi:hypothetical protein
VKPKYEHDCDKCTFLGPYREYDLYVCDGTVLARYGSGSRYVSGIPGVQYHDFLQMAMRRATEIGIDPMNYKPGGLARNV